MIDQRIPNLRCRSHLRRVLDLQRCGHCQEDGDDIAHETSREVVLELCLEHIVEVGKGEGHLGRLGEGYTGYHGEIQR